MHIEDLTQIASMMAQKGKELCHLHIKWALQLSTKAQISFIYKVNSKGPKIEPCGTPCFQFKTCESNHDAVIHGVLLER